MKKNSMILLCLSLSLVFAIVSGVTAYILPHLPLIWQLSGALAIVLFVAYVILDREHFGKTFSKKTTRYGANAVAMCLIAFGIAIFANLIANEHDLKKDFTKNQLHSLAEQSVKVAKNLKGEVTIKAIVDPRQRESFDDYFKRYSYHNKNIKIDFVDLDKDPQVVREYKVKPGGLIVIESGTRSARIENLSQGTEDPKLEEKLTNALIQVEKGEKKKIYFISGHGEHLPSETGAEGYSTVKETLENGRYNVQELVLLQVDKLPADAELLISAGPKSDFIEHELKLLEDYVRGGGKLLLMLESQSSPKLQPFLAKFGIDWKPNKIVYETNPLQKLVGTPVVPIVATYDNTSDITKDLKQISVFPIATPVEKAAGAPADLKVTSLFSTSRASLEVEFKNNKLGHVDPNKDRKGPLSLAVSVSGAVKKADDKATADAKNKAPEKSPEKADDKKPEFRMVVVGDSDFAGNGTINNGVNSDLFQNMLSWLAQEEDLISIRPKPTDSRELNITEAGSKIIRIASLLILPFGMLLTGFAVWLNRRRK